ncbi:hypothetical protein JYU34_007574 [Plutella xylostella]|uniref:Uncharacterized protein n=1 Tax=Plutella xylostella TaxID=51655 RepID=A0ABQ7QQT7_PLUXY|nr:hypothetical protein JYU34_007574 [Plutella xylostella]
MPRKNLKKRRGSANIKEKRQRTTKLMEISLRVDDHVYRNKNISAAQARGYLHEVMELKAQCQDVQSLQVVEKLTRVMKQIIIEEDKDLRMETTDTYDNSHSNELTPDIDVFSVSRAHFISDRHAIEGVPPENTKKDATFYQVGDTVDLHYDLTIDLTDEIIGNVEETIKIRSPNHSCVAEVSRGISNLSVHEDGNLSNNKILDPHAAIGDFDSCAQGFEEYEKKLTVNLVHTVISKTNENENGKNGLKPIVEPVTPVTTEFKENKKKPDGKPKSNKVTKTNAKRKFKPPAKIPSVRESGKKATLTKNKSIPMGLINENELTNTSDAAKSKENPLKIRQDSKNALHGSAKKPAASRPEPYIETDLSWIENIKYVRQVSNDEYIPSANISHSFWNNCDFPPDWDDTDFVSS